MDNIITAQELKTKGVQILKSKLKKHEEVVITVRGEKTYVVIPREEYKILRECQTLIAVHDVERDIANGDYTIETPEEHIEKLNKSLNV